MDQKQTSIDFVRGELRITAASPTHMTHVHNRCRLTNNVSVISDLFSYLSPIWCIHKMTHFVEWLVPSSYERLVTTQMPRPTSGHRKSLWHLRSSLVSYTCLEPPTSHSQLCARMSVRTSIADWSYSLTALLQRYANSRPYTIHITLIRATCVYHNLTQCLSYHRDQGHNRFRVKWSIFPTGPRSKDPG